jgi:hypothetical protein
MKWSRIILLVLILLAAWWVWQRFFVTDETRIRLQLVSMARAVEQGNVLRLDGTIASDYSDDFGMDKSTLLAGIAQYRQQHDGLFIHLSDVQIEVQPDHKRARALLIAKVVSKSKSGQTESDLFSDRFRLFFRNTNQGWQLIRAESPELKFD